jgi:pimeloyl-ACP methyl ester carboxylesterase
MSGADADPSSLRVGDLDLRVSVRGTEGRPLLLVNGLGAPLETWEPLRDELGPQRTIAFDAPGTGGSSTPGRPLTIRDLAHLALAVVDLLDSAESVAESARQEFDVLGYSFGGAVAQELARLVPDRVSRLVLAATNFGWGSPLGDPFAVLSAATAGASIVPRPDPLGYWWQLLAISTWSSFPWISRVRHPTLVLAGAHDRVAPVSAARLLARELPNGELVVVDGEHWFLIHDGVHEAAAHITEFVARDQRFDASGAAPDGALVCT